MDIILQSNEYRRLDAKGSKSLIWNLMAGAAGLSLLTTMAMMAKAPVEKSPAPQIPDAHMSLDSSRSEGFRPPPMVAEAEAAPAYHVVPTAKPSVFAMAEVQPVPALVTPLAMPVRRIASPDFNSKACDAGCQDRAPIGTPARAWSEGMTSEMFRNDQGYDVMPARPGPLSVARSVLGKAAYAPMAVFALGRDAVDRVVSYTD
jgi:hypothetical protein